MMRSRLRRLTRGRWPRVRAGEQLSCAEIGRLMQRFLDGELDDDVEVQAVIDHLDHCERCGLERDVYERIKEALIHQRPPVDAASITRLEEFGRRLVDG